MKVSNLITVDIPELTAKQWEKLENDLTFVKPSDGNTVICYRRMLTKGQYLLPRGAWSLLPNTIRYHDNRSCPKKPVLNFTAKLDNVEKDERFKGQVDAVAAMIENEQGMIIRPPGTGKSLIGLAFASLCQTRTLVIVHTEDILQQWIRYVEANIPELRGQVGVIRGNECRIGHITIATVQTLYRKYMDKPAKWWEKFGCVIADECHHASANTWEAVLNTCPARYRFGFTASATRADGMHPTMRFIIGPVIHRQKFSSPVKLTVQPVKTGFRTMYRGAFDWANLLDTLVTDEERNTKIAEVADEQIRGGNYCLVLSRRIEHLERIAELMSEPCEILTGKRRKADRERILGDFRDGRIRCVLATQLADEALDVPRLDRVLLTHPGKHEGRIVQQVGRALRKHPGKKDAIIFDFVDDKVGVLRNQWNQRKRTYKANKIDVAKNGRLFG